MREADSSHHSAVADDSASFRRPPAADDDRGQPRRAGFELELTGLELPQIVAAVQEEYGGEPRQENRYRYRIEGAEVGDFTAELDWSLLNEMVLRERFADLGLPPEIGEVTDKIEELLGKVAGTVVPMEVVSPPLPLDRLGSLERLREGLRRRGAVGTGGSLAYAFGLHVNPQIPDPSAASLLAHLRSFLVLEEWLQERDGLDLTRRISPFINPFPRTYVRRVTDLAYAPDLPELIDDYLEDNPTRNRALDMLPVFAHLDADRVRDRLEEPLIQARPTFHFRLPSCRVDDPDWRIAFAWNLWVTVEELAADASRLEEASAAYSELLASPLSRLPTGAWLEKVKRWL